MAWFSNWVGGGAAPGSTNALGSTATLPRSQEKLGSGPLSGSADGPFAVGDLVEYYSASQGNWILAKVLAANASGTYNLDCKPDVPASKVRRPQGAGGATGSSAKPLGSTGSLAPGSTGSLAPGSTGALNTGTYAPGEIVEYYSASQGGWIPAKVLAANSKGTYNLDCKPDVSTDKIRKSSRAANSGSTDNGPRAASAGGSDMSNFFSGLGSYMSPSTMPKSTGDLRPGSNQNAPVQLLRVTKGWGGKWQYEVCEEGARLLERYGSRRIAVASICGLYRTGKSYLLNLLLERVQRGLPLFQVGSTTKACTEGLWLWGSLDSDDDQRPLLAFIDCEGFGSTDSDKTRDAQLLTLCSLLSSVLMLNTKGALNESLFNALALTCKFAEHIEERGNEASRPGLLWVLRDFMLELRDASGRPTSPDEYLEQALSSAPTDQDRGQGAREVRQSLLKFFGQRSCVTLVQPAIEERQLQNLSNTPYTSLRSEFRAGVEALRTQLVTTCHANPKTISGHPLSCYGFVALLRQLSTAMNESKALSVKGAWETVQHTACGSLSDELRGSACETLRALAKGTPLPGGAQLPLTDEALRQVLRHQRHELKSQWEERAVGDEAVRKEYWQELKESLAREEFVVKQQNVRIAEQRLVDMLKHWQDWLDDETSTWPNGERVAKDLGTLFEQMPAAPLCRTSRAAIEAAGRRVAAARSAVAATTEQSAEAQRQAVAFGEKAAQQHGAARSELDTKKKELQDHQESLKVARANHAATEAELERRHAELRDTKDQHQKLLMELEDARGREHEHKSKAAYNVEKEAAMKADLEKLQSDYAKAQAEHLSAQRLHSASGETWDAERRRMESDIEQLRVQVRDHQANHSAAVKELDDVKGKAQEHGMEKTKLSAELEAQGMEKTKLSRELEQAKTHAADKARLEADLEHHRSLSTAEKARLEAELEQLRAQAKEKSRIEAELNEAKLQVSDKRRLELELDHHKSMASDKERRYDSDLSQYKSQAGETKRLEAELASEAAENKRLKSELDFAKTQAEKYAQQLTEERGQSRGENEKTRAEHMKMVEDTRQKLEDERKAHSLAMDEEKNRLLDKERAHGVMEGKVNTMSDENQKLREKVAEMEKQARENDATKQHESEQLKKDLEKERAEKEKERAEKAEFNEKHKEEVDEYEKRLEQTGKKPKCGCTVM